MGSVSSSDEPASVSSLGPLGPAGSLLAGFFVGVKRLAWLSSSRRSQDLFDTVASQVSVVHCVVDDS